MKRWVLYNCAFLLPISALAQHESADTSNVLDDVVIQEAFESEFKEEKIPFDIDLDFSHVVKLDLSLNWDSFDEVQDPKSFVLQSDLPLRLSSPELTGIQPAPVKIFRPNFKQLSRWQLDISESNGEVFRTMAGQGNPPQEIAWDGKSNAGEPLIAGEDYAYSFTAVDKAGNKKTFPGSTFSVPAFYIFHDDGLLIGVDTSELFDREGTQLAAQAERYAREIAGLVRHYSQDGGLFFESDAPFVDHFLAILADDLFLDEDDFMKMNSGGDDHRHNSLNLYVK